MQGNRVLHIDFETFSPEDLKACGLENYIAAKGFAVTICAWAFDDEPVKRIRWPETLKLPAAIRAHVDVGGEVRAWNAAFERAVLMDHYGVAVSEEQTVCVMQKALAYGLPGGLLLCGQALNAPVIKDESARRNMLECSKPRKLGLVPWHEDKSSAAISRMNDHEEYCANDVEAERCLDKMIPDLHPFERKLSILDAKMNRLGVRIDIPAVQALQTLSEAEMADLQGEAIQISGGEITNPATQSARLVQWFAGMGLVLNGVAKDDVLKALALPVLPYNVRRMLEIRQLAAKSSVAKLQKMLDVASMKDNRARYLFQFYGAGRTGRWAGRLIQPQNLPRANGFDSKRFISAVLADPFGTEGLRALWPNIMDCISRSLRALMVAGGSNMMISVDLSQIEARVLAWLAGQTDIVEAFRRGEDVYVLQAGKVGSKDRQLGKVLTLACGFGMGDSKFQETAAAAPYFVELTAGQAYGYLHDWRNANKAICGYWSKVQGCVEQSLRNVGKIIEMGHGMAVRTQAGVTQIRKPNGVKLTYHNMRFEDGGLVFDGVDPISKRWGTIRTYGGKLVENIVQSVARDIMAEGMIASAVVPVMTIHDDVVWENWGMGGVFQDAMETVPAWAKGLPLSSSLLMDRRYIH